MRVTRIFMLALAVNVAISYGISPYPALAAEMRVNEMAVTTKIVRGKPIDSVRRISSTSVKYLYCFTRLTWDTEEETVIRHVWHHNGKVERETELPVRAKRWRTHSKREISKESVGDWRVDAIDGDGKLLKSIEFRIN